MKGKEGHGRLVSSFWGVLKTPRILKRFFDDRKYLRKTFDINSAKISQRPRSKQVKLSIINLIIHVTNVLEQASKDLALFTHKWFTQK